MGRRPEDGNQYGRKPLIDRIMEEYSKIPGADIGEMNLTEDEQRILERWIFIDGLMRKHRPKLKMQDIEAMTRRRFNISNGQFWIDWKNTDRLFGTTFSRSKAYSRTIYIEHLEQVASLAELRGDYKAQVHALEVAAKLMGLFDKDEEDKGNDEPKQFIMPILVSDPKLGAGTTEMIDLDKLNELRPDLFERIVTMTDQPTVNADSMENLLNA